MDNNPQTYGSPIVAIMKGLSLVESGWSVFSPNCDPFRGIKNLIQDVQHVPTASRGIFLAHDSQTPSVVFVPNRQLPSVLDGLAQFNSAQVSPLILVVEDHPFVAPHM